MACDSGMPRCVRMVGSMNRMPFDDQRKQNETIQSRIVRSRAAWREQFKDSDAGLDRRPRDEA